MMDRKSLKNMIDQDNNSFAGNRKNGRQEMMNKSKQDQNVKHAIGGKVNKKQKGNQYVHETRLGV
jgi:uncharacterized membrane protein